VVTGGWITQADRSRWQQRAAGELAVILAAHPDLPVLAWTVTASGGALSGQVLAPGKGRRVLFAQWQRALGLDEAAETLDHPGKSGGSGTWKDAGPWRCRRNIPMSCANAR
jgi:hypothetical protein